MWEWKEGNRNRTPGRSTQLPVYYSKQINVTPNCILPSPKQMSHRYQNPTFIEAAKQTICVTHYVHSGIIRAFTSSGFSNFTSSYIFLWRDISLKITLSYLNSYGAIASSSDWSTCLQHSSLITSFYHYSLQIFKNLDTKNSTMKKVRSKEVM